MAAAAYCGRGLALDCLGRIFGGMLRQVCIVSSAVILCSFGCQHRAEPVVATHPEPTLSSPLVAKRTAIQLTEHADRPRILYINDDSITAAELIDPLMPSFVGQAASLTADQMMPRVIQRISDELVRRVQDLLLHREASKSVTDQMTEVLDRYVDDEIKDLVNREFGGRQARFEAHLASQKRTIDHEREQIRRRLIIVKYLQDNILPKISSPTRRELLDYYEANLSDYTQPASRKLLMIDIPKAGNEDDARVAIDQAHARLVQGESFESVAGELSRGIHAAEGGAWGAIQSGLQGRYAEASAHFFELADKQFSEIIDAEDAFFIVKATDVHSASTLPFADVQPELVERYRNTQFDTIRGKILQSLFDSAVVEPDEETFLKAAVASAMERIAAELKQ